MDKKIALILLICLILPEWSFQQAWDARNSGLSIVKKNRKEESIPRTREPSSWKAVAIIITMVLFFGGVVYGTNCFYICKWHFFERREKKYTKMDSCTNV